jgi:predicted signal transduction protein with EAL and GGDEF domain/DNA-binding response OmpR family regulator
LINNDLTGTLLVAHADRAVRVALRAAVERVGGLAMIEAELGQIALDTFDKIRPDAIVLSADIARSHGERFGALMKTEHGSAAVPVVVLTDTGEPDDLPAYDQLEITDVSATPGEGAALAMRIRNLIRAHRDATALRRCEARLASAQRMAKMGTFEYAPRTGDFTASDELHQLLGVPLRSLSSLGDLVSRVHPDDREPFRQAVMEADILCEARAFHHRVVNDEGAVTHLRGAIEPGPEGHGGPFLVATLHNDTDRVLARERIQLLSHFDTLTGLPNRTFLKRQLQVALKRSRRTKGAVAVLFLDLDHFKHVNDSFGHSAGDALLQALAQRLTSCLRMTDTMARLDEGLWSERERPEPIDGPSAPLEAMDLGVDNDPDPDRSVSRFGGDEFVILLTDLARWDHVVTVVRRVYESLQKPFLVEDQEVFATVSVGISLFPEDGTDPERLLKNADLAMNHAKEKGRNTWQFYNISMNDSSNQRLTLETNLRKAIAREEFVPYYQPQVDARTGRIVGAEVLIRWRRADQLVPPAEFIPLAEDTGLIVPIGEWILRAASLQAQQWRQAGHDDLRVSVNLSPRQFQKESIAALLNVVECSGLERGMLELEITEGILCEDAEETVKIIERLKAAGARVCIDDFGTGYSSLSYLKQFPIDTLKIDRSFVNDIKPGSEALLTLAIVNLAHSMKIDLVAEGVETSAQRDFLLRKGCPVMQGYFFSRPVPAEDLTRLLERQTETPALVGAGAPAPAAPAPAAPAPASFGGASHRPARLTAMRPTAARPTLKGARDAAAADAQRGRTVLPASTTTSCHVASVRAPAASATSSTL